MVVAVGTQCVDSRGVLWGFGGEGCGLGGGGGDGNVRCTWSQGRCYCYATDGFGVGWGFLFCELKISFRYHFWHRLIQSHSNVRLGWKPRIPQSQHDWHFLHSRDCVALFGERKRGQSIVAPDGNKAWKSEAVCLCLHVQSVHHQVKNFVSKTQKEIPGSSNYAGSQYIDRSWRWLKNGCLKPCVKRHVKTGVPNYTPLSPNICTVGAGVRNFGQKHHRNSCRTSKRCCENARRKTCAMADKRSGDKNFGTLKSHIFRLKKHWKNEIQM